MFATAAMGVVFLAPLALIALFVFMLKSNRTILSLVPLALLIVFLIFNYNEFMQVVDIVIHHSLIWMIPLVVLVLLLLRSIGILAKFMIILVGCAAGLFIQFGVLMPATKAPVNPFDFSTDMTSAMLYRYSGGSVDLNNSDLEDLKTFLAETEMYEDLMEKAKYEVVNDETVWYMVDATLADGDVVRVTVFPQGDESDVLRIERDGEVACYEAVDAESDIGAGWIRNCIETAKYNHYKNMYETQLSALKHSFSMQGTNCSFTIPNDFPEEVTIHFEAYPEGSGEDDLLYGIGELLPGETYHVDVSKYAVYRSLHLSVEVSDVTYDLVNVFDLLPEEMKSDSPSGRYQDSEIE